MKMLSYLPCPCVRSAGVVNNALAHACEEGRARGAI
jgi:hypothetical protein